MKLIARHTSESLARCLRRCSSLTNRTPNAPCIRAVTAEQLEHPDASDWLRYRRTYDCSGFSPLNQRRSW